MTRLFGVVATTLVVASVLLPSGSLGPANVKIGLAVAGLVLSLAIMLTKGAVPRWALLLAGGVLAPTLVAAGVGVARGVPTFSIASQLSAVASTVALVWIPWHQVTLAHDPDRRAHATRRMYRVVLGSVAALAFVKVALSVLLAFDVLRVTDVVAASRAVFGQGFIYLEVGAFSRIFFPADFVVVPVVFALVAGLPRGLELRTPTRTLMVGLLLLSTIVAYSRLLWALVAFAIAMAALVHVAALVEARRVRTTAVVLVTALVLTTVVAVAGSGLAPFVATRYTGDWATRSDDVRAAIAAALVPEIEARPFFGSGLGASAPRLVRFPPHPWNYELQWHALLMHYGVIGLTPILVTVLAWLLASSRPGDARGVATGIMASSWIMVGLVNSFLLTSSAGVVFLTFLLLASRAAPARPARSQAARPALHRPRPAR